MLIVLLAAVLAAGVGGNRAAAQTATRCNPLPIPNYRPCTPAVGTGVRLVITGWPKGIKPAVAEFTVFGTEKTPP